MEKASQHRIFMTAVAAGMSRSNASVFAIIAYWEQIPGGIFAAGQQVRYRLASEIAAETGYGLRTVVRATSALRAQKLIGSKTIWHPSVVGKRVNGYWLEEAGKAVLDSVLAKEQNRRSRKRQFDTLEAVNSTHPNKPLELVRYRQNDCFKYIEQDQVTSKIQDSLSTHEGKKFYQYLDLKKEQEESVYIAFQDYLQHRYKGHDRGSPEIFWKCLKDACGKLIGATIENWSPTVGGRVQQFLGCFDNDQSETFDPIEACMCAFWAYANPNRFASMIADACGSWPKGKETHTYSLSVRAYVLVNHLKQSHKNASDRPEPDRLGAKRHLVILNDKNTVYSKKEESVDLCKFIELSEEENIFGEAIENSDQSGDNNWQ